MLRTLLFQVITIVLHEEFVERFEAIVHDVGLRKAALV
jgi:hypothetical protein